MGINMRASLRKPTASQQSASVGCSPPSWTYVGPRREAKPTSQSHRSSENPRVQGNRINAEDVTAQLCEGSSSRFGYDFRRVAVHPSGAIPTDLAINRPGDAFEQEADRLTDHVMHMPVPQLQRQKQEHIQPTSVQTTPSRQIVASLIVHNVLRSPGYPLDSGTRAFMEPRFGYDFGQVRIHTDAKAAESARAVDSLAYTVGRHIVFGAGQYQPGSPEGSRLLGHELAHTIQQAGGAQMLGMLQRTPKKQPASQGTTDLRDKLQALADKKTSDYVTYRYAIANAPAADIAIALGDQALLTNLQGTLSTSSFARCVEALGRKAPSFDELKKNTVVLQAITDAWTASDVGVKDLVTQPHEEGGWIFLNLIDGSLSIQRAKAEYTDAIKLEPAPRVTDSILVGLFHTHPSPSSPGPSRPDLKEDKRRGVPNLVAIADKKAKKGAPPFKIMLSGPAARKHLASDTSFPGPSGGISP